MSSLRAISLLAVLIASSPLPAQPAPPDPATLELGRLLMARDERLYDDADTGTMRVQLQERLLAIPNGCAATSSECQSAAAEVALEFAPAFREAERGRRELITAHLIADRLSPEQARHALAYLRSDEGTRLFELLDLLRRPAATARRRRELERVVQRAGAPDVFPAARTRFLVRTRHLPRGAPR